MKSDRTLRYRTGLTIEQISLFALLLPFLWIPFGEKPAGDPGLFEGLWRATYSEYTGEIPTSNVEVLENTKGRLSAAINWVPVEIGSFGQGVMFFADGGKKGFRGEWSADSLSIIGHWIESGFASPLILQLNPSSPDRHWWGVPDAKATRFDLFVKILRDTSGILQASITDREYNIERFVRIQQAVVANDTLYLYREDSEVFLSAVFVEPDSLTGFLAIDPDQTIGLTRISESEELKLHPQSGKPYSYREPKPMGDQVRVGSLSGVGFDQARMVELVEAILNDKDFRKVHSILVAKNGKLVLEEYFFGYDAETLHSTRSVGKSLTAALTGIAIDRGHIPDEEASVYSYFQKYPDAGSREKDRKDIRIRHLLTMTSGLDCNDFDDSSPGNEDRMQSQTTQPDWTKFILDLDLVNPPGEEAFYCTGGVNLLGDIISEASGTWIPAFLHDQLFDPLGIKRYQMNLTPTGNGYLGGGIQMLPRDMLKFGQLFLNDGRWGGEQVISAEWVKKCWTPRVSINGGDPDYGYLWWYDRFTVNGVAYDCYSASGNGGQFIFGVPELDLVCVVTGGNYGAFRNWIVFKKFVSDFLIPAAAGK